MINFLYDRIFRQFYRSYKNKDSTYINKENVKIFYNVSYHSWLDQTGMKSQFRIFFLGTVFQY